MEYRPKTRTELNELRKQELRQVGSEFIEKYMRLNPQVIQITKPCQLVPPHFTSPYIENPAVKTKSELEELRKSQGLQMNQKTLNLNYKSLSERVEEREQLRVIQTPETLVKEDDKSEAIKSYQSKFSKRPVGVHGVELPKFKDHLQEFWKIRDGYKEHPVRPKEEKSSRPISVFTRLRPKSGSANSEVTKKPGEINPFPGFVPREIEIGNSRPGTGMRFAEDFLNSRPGSAFSKENLEKLSRPVTAGVKPENSSRPKTAATAKTSEKNLIRSSGFL